MNRYVGSINSNRRHIAVAVPEILALVIHEDAQYITGDKHLRKDLGVPGISIGFCPEEIFGEETIINLLEDNFGIDIPSTDIPEIAELTVSDIITYVTRRIDPMQNMVRLHA